MPPFPSKSDATDRTGRPCAGYGQAIFAPTSPKRVGSAYCAELAAMETRLGTAPKRLCSRKRRPLVAPHRYRNADSFRAARQAPGPCHPAARLCRRYPFGRWSAARLFRRHRPAGRLVHGRLRVRTAGRAQDHRPRMGRKTDRRTQDSGDIQVAGTIATPLGPIEKHLRFHGRQPRVDFDLTFHWPEWGKGALRLGHIPAAPEAFGWETDLQPNQNGGKTPEHFPAARGRSSMTARRSRILVDERPPTASP